jgi:hypothetical protein
MESWDRRLAISNVWRSIIISRFAASPKSLILLTLTGEGDRGKRRKKEEGETGGEGGES